MRIGLGIAQSSWPQQREFAPEEVADFAVAAEELGFASLWAGDHFFLEFGPHRRIERAEPYVLLSYLAARTSRIQLGTLVTGAPFRNPGLLARQAKTLADFSGGRFILGIGSGWQKAEFEAFGYPGDKLASRFQEYVEAIAELFAGGRVDYDGGYLKLRGAEVGGERVPPIMLGAVGPRAIDLVGRKAQGWNFGGSLEEFVPLLAQVREREAAAGRPAGSVFASAATCVVLGDEKAAAELVANMPPGVGSVVVGEAALLATVDAYREAGCDHLILHLGGVPFSSFGSDPLELAASVLGPKP